MKNTLVLDMLVNGQINELKDLLTDEIYQDSLKKTYGAKERYAAMKRYFKYVDKFRPACSYPCEGVELNDMTYNCFLDGYSLALTTESIGTIKPYNTEEYGPYFKVDSIVNFNSFPEVCRVDLNKVLAEAKSKGYKFKKSETTSDFRFMLRFKDGKYKMSLLDRAFGIVNDGDISEVYYKNNISPLLIKTSIGIALILPMRSDNDGGYEKIFADEMIVQ